MHTDKETQTKTEVLSRSKWALVTKTFYGRTGKYVTNYLSCSISCAKAKSQCLPFFTKTQLLQYFEWEGALSTLRSTKPPCFRRRISSKNCRSYDAITWQTFHYRLQMGINQPSNKLPPLNRNLKWAPIFNKHPLFLVVPQPDM